MSGRQVNRSNTYSRLSHPNNTPFPPRTPGWTHYSNTNNVKGLGPHIPSGPELSTSSGHLEQPCNPASPKLPVGNICLAQPYNSRCVETSHLLRGPKVARKPSGQHSNPQCLLCTDRPSSPSSPTFLDQLIKGINYLDRSTNVFSNSYPKALSLPQLAASYLERAANSLYLDPVEPAPPRSYSTPSTNIDTPANHSPANNCLVPSIRDTNTLQYSGGSTGLNCQHQPHNQSFSAEIPQRPGVKLPEIPLFGNGLLSLGRLPKFWETIRSGWNAHESTSKPSGWW
ncbi:uncharacterized protein LOC101827439 [Mesocricetus auratus]|uniref:Uncharacterized protein LOC101827439 n=1 Tax=Mesocricetus auratus TaxID=10036 RepID=A0A1U7R7F3_MESAU|nr:uncharacterized protein LOC101827439 [Mesocricetus auratus]XP_040613364.1 uncharacterized protein LOC101827439 [Mesocricetus auratus]